MRSLFRAAIFAVPALGIFTHTAYAVPVTPTYVVNLTDATWTLSGGQYTVPTSAEVYENEVWERGIEDQKWSDSGGTRSLDSEGLYRAFGDLLGGGLGVGDGGDGVQYLFAYWDVVGQYEDKASTGGIDASGVGLKGHYYFYFETLGANPFMIEIENGNDLSPGSTYVANETFVFQAPASEVYGTAILTTCEDDGGSGCPSAEPNLPMDGFQTELNGGNTNSNYARRPTGMNRIEIAIPLSILGLTSSAFTGTNLNWAYWGVATSNPSSQSLIFANDFFSSAKGFGVEYDTLRYAPTAIAIATPEPATLLLLGAGLLGVGFRSRRRKN